MRSKKAYEIINESNSKPKILASNRYVKAQLDFDRISQLAIQMGPNCNLNCPHCYGDYGVHRTGLPDLSLIEKTLEQSEDAGIRNFVLTDGEPFRPENKSTLGNIAEYIGDHSNTSLEIITNATFGETQKTADEYICFIKNKGFDLRKGGNGIIVSTGPMYNLPLKNYYNINRAIEKSFTKDGIDEHLYYNFIINGNPTKKDNKNVKGILNSLYDVFRKGDEPFLINKEKNSNGTSSLFLNFKDSRKFEIVIGFVSPNGRARNMPIIQEKYPERNLNYKNLDFSAETVMPLYLSSRGDLLMMNSGACLSNGRIYGNIKTNNLSDIKWKILEDSIYQANQLGGVRFMSFLAKDKIRNVKGRIKCDMCHEIFNDLDLVDSIRKKLSLEGVAKSYKNYLKKAGLPNQDR